MSVETSSTPVVPEIPKGKEGQYSRGQVIEAVKSAYSLWNKTLSPLTEATSAKTLPPEHRAQLDFAAQFQLRKFDTPSPLSHKENKIELAHGLFATVKEGLPVEDLISYSQEKLADPASTLSADEKAKLEESLQILIANSKPYTRKHRLGGYYANRVQQEAQRLAEQQNKKTPSVLIRAQAEQNILKRRELILPKETKEEKAARERAETPSLSDPTDVSVEKPEETTSETPENATEHPTVEEPEQPTTLPTDEDDEPTKQLKASQTAAAVLAAHAGATIPAVPLIPPPPPSTTSTSPLPTTLPITTSSTPPPPPPPAPVAPSPSPDSTPPAPVEVDESASEVIDEPLSMEGRRYQILIANNTEHVSVISQMLAREAMNEEWRAHAFSGNKIEWIKSLRHKVWLRWTEPAVINQYKDRIMQSLITNNDSLLEGPIGLTAIRAEVQRQRDILNAENKQTVDRLKNADEQDVATGTTGRGERRVALEEHDELRSTLLAEVLKPIVEGTISSPAEVKERLNAFVEAHNTDARIKELFGANANKFADTGEWVADIFEQGLQLKRDVEAHRVALENIDHYVDIQLGLARAQVNSENFDAVDRAIIWAKKRHDKSREKRIRKTGEITRGILDNPVIVGTSMALLYRFAFMPARAMGKSTHFSPLMVGAAFAGIAAADRERKQTNVDIAQHRAERTYNMQIVPENGKRRKEIEKADSKMVVGAHELVFGGRDADSRDIITAAPRKSLLELKGLDVSDGQESNRKEVASRIAEIQAREEFGVINKRDYIRYDSRSKSAENLLQLTKMKVELRQKLRAAGMDNEELKELENSLVGKWKEVLDKDKKTVDKDMRNYKTIRMLKGGVLAAGTSVVGGLVGQEVLTVGKRAIDQVLPAPHTQTGPTILEKTINDVSNKIAHKDLIPQPHGSTTEMQAFYKNGGNLRLSDQLRLDIDKTTHLAKLINTQTNQPVPSPDLIVKPNGHVLVNGDASLLPADIQAALKDWKITGATSPLQEQLIAVQQAGKDTTVMINGQSIPFVNGKLWPYPNISGEIDSNGVIQFAGNANSTDQFQAVVKSMGLEPRNINYIDTPSVHDKMTEFIQHYKQGDLDYLKNHNQGKLITDDGTTQIHIFTDGSDQVVFTDLTDPNHTSVIGHFYKDIETQRVYPDGQFKGQPQLDRSGNIIPPRGELYNVRVDGDIPQTFKDKLHIAGFNFATDADSGREKANPLEVFKERVENPHREFWHDNGTTMHLENGRLVGADGKELQFYHHVTPDGKIDLDMSHMLSTPNGRNWDGTIDSQYGKIMKDIVVNKDGTKTYKNFEFLLTVNDSADQARQVLSIPVDSNGHAQVPAEYMKFFALDNNGQPLLRDGGNPVQLARFIEVAHVQRDVDGHILKSTILSTTEGKGIDTIDFSKPGTIVAPPDIKGHSTMDVTVPRVTELVPPDLDESYPVFPLTPFAPRRSLEKLELVEKGYQTESFNATHTIADIIKRGRITPRGSGSTHSPGAMTEFGLNSRTEGEESLKLIHDRFETAEHVYIALAGAIGDAAITSAYIDGIRQYAERTSTGKRMTIVAPDLIIDMLRPTADKYGYELVTADRYECVNKAREFISTLGEKNAMVFDFDFTTENGPNPILEDAGDDNTIIHELFAAGVGLYKNDRAGRRRYGEFLGDLLNIPASERLAIKPVVSLPVDAPRMYDEMKTNYHIDETKQQISLVVEGSGAFKRYDLQKWKDVIRDIADDTKEINIIYHTSYSEDELKAVFDDLPHVRYIKPSIQQSLVFLQKQDLVIANDTGLSHLAAIVENGPQVISVHGLDLTPNTWITNTTRHIGIWSGSNDKDVNTIPPERVKQEVERQLATLPTRP